MYGSRATDSLLISKRYESLGDTLWLLEAGRRAGEGDFPVFDILSANDRVR